MVKRLGYENKENYRHGENAPDLLSDSLNSFFKEMYGDQFGEFV